MEIVACGGVYELYMSESRVFETEMEARVGWGVQ
jgi:hypothetical protein